MNDQGLSSDIITTFPQHIIENILTLMPIQDALRTSILSSKWRYCWTIIPKLVFYDKLFEVELNSIHLTKVTKQKFVDAIFHVLLLHKGPILEFNLSVDKIKMISKFDPKFDQIILHLSRRNELKTLKIKFLKDFYALPTSFFSLQGLEDLELVNCELEPPLSFNGYPLLRKVLFDNVEAAPKMFKSFLSGCPLLEEVTLLGGDVEDSLMEGDEYTDYLAGQFTSVFVELLPCVPLIQVLNLSKYYMKLMAAGGMPHKLPISLSHLKTLNLDVCLMEQHDISSVLCLIRSSPNLEDIFFMMYDNEKFPVRATIMNFCDPDDYSDLNLDHLEKLEIQNFSNFPLEMEFIKLIMAKSPMLKRARVELSVKVSADEELEILRNFLLLPFPRAPTAKLIIERPTLKIATLN